MPNLVSLTRPQSLDVGQNSDGGISTFQISGQSLIKEKYYNSRTCNDIGMKLGPVTKLTRETRKIDDDAMLTNCDTIVTFPNLWPIWSHPEDKFRTQSL